MTRILSVIVLVSGLMSEAAFAGTNAMNARADARDPNDIARLRSHSQRIMTAIDDARKRSATFRALYDRLQRSDLIIYVESGRCGSVHVLSCVAVTAGANGFRYLRIIIDTQHSRGLITRQIAHEFQHALEIAGAPQVVDAKSLRRLYERIGRMSLRPNTFETAAAVAVAETVSNELKQ